MKHLLLALLSLVLSRKVKKSSKKQIISYSVGAPVKVIQEYQSPHMTTVH